MKPEQHFLAAVVALGGGSDSTCWLVLEDTKFFDLGGGTVGDNSQISKD